ncbi:MAG: nucleotidyltransferase family protein [Thermoanaerobaculia bacterium]
MIGAPRVDRERLESLCLRWGIRELSLFGSAIRSDFGPASDVDVLVSFSMGSSWSLLDLVRLNDELEALFGRRVDLVEKEAVRNPFRRRTILGDRRILYAA